MIATLLALLLSAPADAPDLWTVAEATEFRATATSDEVLDLCRRLADSSPCVRLDTLGGTVEGRPIPLLLVGDPLVRTPEEAAKSGKLVALLVGNIHAGEVCGKEALPMLVREILAEPGRPRLKDLILAVVPNFNADGNDRMATTNRPGQVGPERGMGQRPNAQGLDLNRDFVRLESPEVRALVRFIERWDPHLVVDTHTTNGSLHRYTMTYQGPQNPAGPASVRDYVRTQFLPAADAAFERDTDYDAFFYGNFEDDHGKWTSFPPTPRFGTNYVGLRGRIAVLTEAYAYAPYKDRVLATRDFVRALLDQAAGRKDEIKALLADARDAVMKAEPGEPVPIRSRPSAFPERVTVLGYEESSEGGRKVKGPERDYEVELVHDFTPTATVARPFAYLLPPRFADAVATLRRHDVRVLELREGRELEVEAYTMDRIEKGRPGYAGRSATIEVTPHRSRLLVDAGTWVVPLGQPLGNLIAYLLEPHSDDSLAAADQFGDLAAGAEYPVLRLMADAGLTTAAPPARPEDRPEKKPITLATMPRRGFGGGPGGGAPRWLDGGHLLQNREGRLHRVDAITGESSPLIDADAFVAGVKERLPDLPADLVRSLARAGAAGRDRGGPEFDPAKTGFLFTHDEDLYSASIDGKTAVRLTSAPGAEELATFSPDGRYVAFVRDNDLHVVDLATQRESALTEGGKDRLRHGKADWVYYEEIYNRRSKAFWWSPDSARLAFLRFDDGPVRDHEVVLDTAEDREVERTPYPKPGKPNPKVTLGVVPVRGGAIRYHDLCARAVDGDGLISDVGWWPDGSKVIAYVQDRTQTWLDFTTVPADGGEAAVLFRETTRAWVESPGMPQFLTDGSFLFPSERDGWRHLYHYASDGTLKRQLTKGEWEVRSVDFVDPEGKAVFLSATKDDPIATNLYRVALDGGEPERLTTRDGEHRVAMSPDGALYVETWSDLDTPPQTTLHRADGQLVRTIDGNSDRLQDEYRFAPRERFQIETKDGFKLEAELIVPADLDPDKRYPVYFTTYAGPHTPTVSDGWAGGRLLDQAMAGEGFVVFRVDPRSASGKGAVSAWSAYKQLGVQELEDIKEAIGWLVENKPFVDAKRIGMAGHSYGGFMTAYALTHCDLFAAGIAGAPVTDWRDYDSIYTERYMLTPEQNRDGYCKTSVVAAAGKLHGRLLIAHGAIDDNVSIRNTMRLAHALQQADKDFELMIYPASRHGIFGAHYSRLQAEFLKRTLGGPEPREQAE